MTFTLLKQVVPVVALSLILSCGNGGGNTAMLLSGAPYIYGELNSFSDSTESTAIVYVINDETGESVSGANVRINGVSLTYNASDESYQGRMAVEPGASVTVTVNLVGTTYSQTGTQFVSYPKILSPVLDSTWQASVANTAAWSPAAPVSSDSFYGLGIMDSGSGTLVWPDYGYLHTVPATETSYTISPNSLTAGTRTVIVGIAAASYFSSAAPGSAFYISGFSYVPVSVSNATLSFIDITPSGSSMARGTRQQYTAVGTFSDSKTQDLTAQVTWVSSDRNKASINSSGLAFAYNVGSTLINASLNGITGSTPLTITPAELVSIAISPMDSVIFNGSAVQFTAKGTFTDGTLQDVTAAATWSSSDAAVATISNATDSIGKAAAMGSGSSMVTATSGSISDSTLMTVSGWTLANSGTNNDLKSIVWSGSQFVAVGSPGLILTSPDGINWVRQNSSVTYVLEDVIWTGTQFVVAGWGGMLTSPDGVTWTARNSGIIGALHGVAWSGSQFVAVGYAGQVITSPDGELWSLRVSGTTSTSSLYDVVWSGTQFVAVGYAGIVLTSPDGLTWTQRSAGVTSSLSDITWSGTEFVVVGRGLEDTILTSADAIEWTTRSTGITNPTPSWYNVVWTGAQYLLVGGNGSALILRSDNGISWNQEVWGTTYPLRQTLHGVAAFGNRLIAVGDRGTIILSP